MPINPKKYSCCGLKKIHTRNLIMKKKFLRLENSPPPHNISNGPSLRAAVILLLMQINNNK